MKCSRTGHLFGMIALLLLPAAAFAELTVEENADVNDTQIYRLTVTPADEPSPAMRYRLVTPLNKLKGGNAPAYYRRIHAEGELPGTYKLLNKEFGEDWYDWIDAEVPISKLPLEDVARAAVIVNDVIEHGARAGADCKRCDWGLAVEELSGLQTISFLLPEFQGMRSITRMTSLQTRLAIAQRRYDDAIDLMRINYRMGRDTGKPPFLVCNLIGLAMVGTANNNALDLIAAPDSPNLYWAIGELPVPIVPLRDAVRFEMSLGMRVFPVLEDAETAVRAPEEWNRLFRDSQTIMPQLVSGSAATPTRIFASLGGLPAGILGYTHAKQRLIDWGLDARRVEKMAVGQVMAIYSARVYRKHADEMEKSFYVPFADSMRMSREAQSRLSGTGPLSDHPDREIFPLADTLLPAVRACQQADMRVRREMALLRTIEAVRMHAAREGSLPAKLSEVKCVPTPLNPATDKPFDYSLDDGLATIVLPKSDDVMPIERRYEIRLAE